ncbi:MAG TPA: hypothetical protein VFL90_11155 [Methylomirabilota bacterium]|nr:hypothetical protein [Methylomirabilota bacterium]
MKIVATSLVLAWLWTLVPVLLGLCGARSRRHRPAAAAEPWVWDALDRGALGQDPALPASHPLTRLGRPTAPSAG